MARLLSALFYERLLLDYMTFIKVTYFQLQCPNFIFNVNSYSARAIKEG